MLRIFQQVALWEAISTVLLFFVAMPLKYFADVPEAVRLAGSIHGFLVVIFIVLAELQLDLRSCGQIPRVIRHPDCFFLD